MAAIQKARPKIVRIEECDGQFYLYARIGPVVRRPSPNGRVYHLLDYERELPQTIDCFGVPLKPKVVLKAYIKIPQSVFKRVRKAQALAAARAGSPILL